MDVKRWSSYRSATSVYVIHSPMELLCYCLVFMTFLLCFLIHHHLSFKKPKQEQKPKLPPGPWQLPVIGSMHHFLRGSKIPQRKLRDLARAHGPLMHLKLGQLHVVVVSSKQTVEEMFKTHDLQFSDRADNGALDITSFGRKGVALTPYGEYWRQMRKICVVELLSAKRVQSFKSVREEEAANIISSIRSADGATINLTQNLRAYTNNVICRAAFGSKLADAAELVSVVDEVTKLLVSVDLADFFPLWEWVGAVSGVRRKAKGLQQRLDRIFEKMIQEHEVRRVPKVAEGDLNNDEKAEDLIDILLNIIDQGDLEVPLTRDHVKGTILDIFGGGSDTSTALLDWAMAELMRNPRVMAKAQAEARRVLSGKEMVTQEDIQKLHYLGLIVKETLRLHPPVPLLLPRKCRETCEIGGYQIPKNTTVMINAWALGRDPEYWSEPDEFRPERFESDGKTMNFKGTDYEFIPFGAGRRNCPGVLFGVSVIELVLGQLLYYFDWKLPHGVTPDHLNMTEEGGSGWNRAQQLFVHAIPCQFN